MLHNITCNVNITLHSAVNRGPCPAWLLWHLHCPQPLALCRWAGLQGSPADWPARSVLRGSLLLASPLWAWVWSQRDCKWRTAPVEHVKRLNMTINLVQLWYQMAMPQYGLGDMTKNILLHITSAIFILFLLLKIRTKQQITNTIEQKYLLDKLAFFSYSRFS